MQLRRERYSTRDGLAAVDRAAAHEDNVACGLARRSSLWLPPPTLPMLPTLFEYVEKACSSKRVLATGPLELLIVLLPRVLRCAA